MSKKKTTRLSDVVPQFAEQGANDAGWFLVEHQMAQVKMSVGVIIDTLEKVQSQPENENEREIATDCLAIVLVMYRHILDHQATFLSYLSDTDVSERISRKEL